MKATYRALAALIPVLVVAQAAFITLGLFGIHSWVSDGNALTKAAVENDPGAVGGGTALSLHFFGAMAVALVALLLLVVSFFARVDGGVRLAALVLGDVVLQWALGLLAFGAVFLGAFHAVNAFVLFGLGMMAVTAATRSLRGAGAPSQHAAAV